MLASNADLSQVRFPVMASPKLDGVRALVRGGVVYSRSGKPIPNAHVQALFGALEGYDGELVVGPADAPEVFRKTQGGVMSKGGTPEVSFFLFDAWDRGKTPYMRWYKNALGAHYAGWLGDGVALLQQNMLYRADELDAYEAQCLAAGFEGVMLRDPDAGYKHGRSTAREGILLKVKRFADSEAETLDMEEQISETGERKNTLGALVVRDLSTGVVFNIASGFTQEDRDYFWDGGPESCPVVRYRYFPSGGKDKPRFPVFSGLRSRLDMEAARRAS
jgi:DNA ligase-1